MVELDMDQNFRDILAIEVKSVASKTPICPFIMGEPGIGKSSVVKAMCEEQRWHFFELLCNQLGDRADLTGCRSVKDKETVNGVEIEIWKQIFFPHQSIQDAITCAQNNPNDIVVLFLDEINRTGSDITSAILSFTTARKIGTYVFPDNIRFIVAGNDKGNITALDSASISRFSKYKLKPNAITYMGIEKNLNPFIEKVLKAHPEFIFGKGAGIVTSQVKADDSDDTFTAEYEAFDDAAEGFEQITTPRTISGMNAFLNACDNKTLYRYVGTITRDADTGEENSLLHTIVYGHVGKTAFAEALLAEISTAVSSAANQAANQVLQPQKPVVYDSIMRCTDRQTRDNMLQGLSDDIKGEVLLYACWERSVNNADLIDAVCRNFNNNFFPSAITGQFISMKQQDLFDPDNYSAFINTGVPVAVTMANILGN